ncbi:MAG TPA: hypothetical protein VFQ61_26555, partial [Polyangiaceae bacterium]|nr:hypothetical protein [Polyangiaceae bacterium]
VLEGAIQRGFGRDVSVVCLGRDDNVERFLVTGAQAAAHARAALDSGASFGQVLVELQRGSGRVAS